MQATDARFMENLESSARNASESMAPVPDLSAYLRHADEMLDAWWALGGAQELFGKEGG